MNTAPNSRLIPTGQAAFIVHSDVPPGLKAGDVVIVDGRERPMPGDFVITKGRRGALTLGLYDPNSGARVAGVVVEQRRRYRHDATGDKVKVGDDG
jgi:hypothetical protein